MAEIEAYSIDEIKKAYLLKRSNDKEHFWDDPKYLMLNDEEAAEYHWKVMLNHLRYVREKD